MENANRIAIRITADEYRLDADEALEHITAIVSRGEEDALEQITGILAEAGRAVATVWDADAPDYDPDSGELVDYDEGDELLGEGMHEGDMSLVNACLDDILKPQRSDEQIPRSK